MTMNPQWGGGINPPEPMPMGGAKSLRSDPGFIGGGLPSSGGGGGLSTSGGGIGGRQITKNPLNMLGGMGSTSNGVYTNGSSSSFDQAVRGGGAGGGVGFPGDRINGSADRVRAPGTNMPQVQGSGIERMSGGGQGLDRMPSGGLDRMGSGGGLDRMATGGLDRMGSGGIDRMSGGGLDRMSAGGLDRMSGGGLDRMSSGGMDRMSAGGLDRMSGGLDRMSGGGLDRMSGGGLDRMSGGGLDRMSGGGLDRMSSGLDRMPSGGLDRMSSGLDRMSSGVDRMSSGLDRMPSGGLDRMPSGGLDRMSGGGLDRMSGGGLDRMSGGGLDRMAGGGLDRMSGGGLDRMSGGGMDRMSGGSGMNGGMGGMMNKMGSGFSGGGLEGGYGMSLNRPQQRSPPSSRFNGFSGSIGDRSISNGNISSMGGGGDRMPPSFPENIRGGDMRDIMNHRDRDMMGGGSGDSRGFFRDLVDTRGHDPRSIGGGVGGAPDHRMSREYQLQQEMRERDMYRMRDNNLVRSNSEMGPERNLAMLDRATGGGSSMMSRGGNMPPRDMMAGGRDYMRSNSDMMGGMPGGRDRMDMMGGARDRMDMMGGGSNRVDMMGGGNNRMDMSSYTPRDNHMMAQRSISMNNGGGSNGGGYGMGSTVGGNMDNGYNRSMSYNNGPSSPPGGSDLKIGTWNEGVSAGNTGANAPVSNFEIGTFNMNSVSGGSNENRNNFNSMGTFGHHSGTGNGTTQSNNGPFQPGMGIRETGIIEKLLHSYGFIQCCDRQARLFFHFSQFEGNIEHLKIGDPVEFEMTYDRRTGKPIASAVSKIAPEVVMSEERVIGTVTTELKVNSESGNETAGRISYENRGECFFLPFNTTDVEGNVTLTSGDKVSFQMATVARSGNLAAKTIRLENPAAPVKYRGVVNSLQDTFGFIERADVVKEIYFNIIDMQDGVKEDNSGIHLGDDVEFIIQTRSGKEVAANLLKLSPGTVVFEDIGTEWFRGQVLKPLDRSGKYQQTEALPGKVKYRAADRSEAEIPFGEKDQLGDFTLKHGDWIKFIVATDRRDKLKRATKIELLDESFSVSDERREQGVVQQVKDGGIGYIKCVDRSDSIMFHFSECLDVSRKVTIGDEMEFTLFQDPKQMLATRIKYLPAGTVKFDIIIAQNILGVVAEEPSTGQSGGWGEQVSGSKMGSESPAKEGAGRIVYELNSVQLSIPVYAGDCEARNPPRLGDKVQFNINQLKATKETNAMNVHVIERANIELPSNTGSANVSGDSDEALALSGGGSSAASKSPTPPVAVGQQQPLDASPQTVTPQPEATAESDTTSPSPPKEKKDVSRLGSPQRGYVAALKDGFGFIETLQHDKEIFFHFSHVEGKADKLEVGQEVEYYVYSREKGGKVSAEGVKVLPKGSIPKPVVKEEMLYGKVARPLRSVNPDQADYCGLIVSKSEEGKILAEYQFGIASLLNKKELLQEGDPVNFQVSSNEPFAYNIKSNKQKLRSNVEAVKGQFGFLTYEQEEGKKLFFHMSEVEGGEVLQVGDQVEFVVVTNTRTKKHSACCVRKLGASQRPERLISKLKALSMEEGTRGGPKLIAIRPPRGPDGTRGFSQTRAKVEEQPCIDLMEQLTAQ